jgi:hypothetical protein
MPGEAVGRCPLCNGITRVWIGLPDETATVGLPSPVDPEDAGAARAARLIDRCDDCKAGIVRASAAVDLGAELEAVSSRRDDGSIELRAPNRGSLQAGIGGEGWAALGEERGRLLHTPRSLELLAEKNAVGYDGAAFPPWGPSQGWMWQTLLNGLTLHTNFAREVRAGRLRPANARSRLAFWADSVATVLASPLVLVVAVPLEAFAALFKRGGMMVARAGR